MKKVIVLCLMLAACSSTDVVKEPMAVNMVVGVPCKAPAVAAPIFKSASVNEKGPSSQLARALAATNEQRKGYEARLVAALKACQ